ncbi:MAG: hypothetical protein KDA60_15525, partial [Planctomycetales bacterium]|nr:hypothetical protein [Planctomycetales bacterium]
MNILAICLPHRLLGVLLVCTTYLLATAALCAELSRPTQSVQLENRFLRRELSTSDGVARTTRIVNLLDGRQLIPTDSNEFRIRLSHSTASLEPDVELTCTDFEIDDITSTREGTVQHLTVQLTCRDRQLRAALHYHLDDNEPFLRKYLELTAAEAWVLERVDVESHAIQEAYQPYQLRAITAQGEANWKPGLGQPLYTHKCGTYWGIEFPAADNFVRDGNIHCGYLYGRQLEPNRTYRSYCAVLGMADDPQFARDAFFEYIDRTRVRPLRLQIQYNSWFDYAEGVDAKRFAKSVDAIHRELVERRGARPLSAYVIDSGWMDTTDWSETVWRVNGKFSPDLRESRDAARNAGSKLGLWISPGCLFGAQSAIGPMRAAGMEAIDPWMSMAGPNYMDQLEARMVELTRTGCAFFKLDGLFGHYITRNFELHGDRYGIAAMPQLLPDGLTGSDARLNDSRYDELKIYYLAAGTQRLMQLFGHLAEADPNIYIVISNGAYLSPWWLQHVDAVWMINAGDAASGSDRTGELVYRDGKYYELWQTEHTQFPLCSLFNHEPKKTANNETKDTFRRYLYMNLSRGTGFVELYIRPSALQDYDWDVLAEGLQWAESVFPTFGRVRMHGGDPEQQQVYGYTAWTGEQGYVSIHNPSDEAVEYSLILNRETGLLPSSQQATYQLSSPIPGDTRGLKSEYQFGDTLHLTLQPREIRILSFDT